MFSGATETNYTQNIREDCRKINEIINGADAVVIGAGAGLSTSAGYTYSGERFEQYFGDFIKKYGFKNMYEGGFYPFESEEEYWAYWSRYIYFNRYAPIPNDLYARLRKIVRDKDYFVITTNVDHCFQRVGFSKKRLFYTQGDYGLFQCSVPCHSKTYDNEEIIVRMLHEQRDMKIPTELIPRCPVCGKSMTMNLRSDNTFVEDEGWHRAARLYHTFLGKHRDMRVVFLELGVGYNTPIIIKYPFWQMTEKNSNAFFISINYGDAGYPRELEGRAMAINDDIRRVICLL